MSLRCRKSMVSIEAFSFFSKRVNHYRTDANILGYAGNDSNLLIVFYVQIMPDDFVMQLHRF